MTGEARPDATGAMPNAERLEGKRKRGRKPRSNGHAQDSMNGTAHAAGSESAIRLEPGQDSEIIDVMEAALIRARASLFQWAGRLVIPARAKMLRPDGREVTRLVLQPAIASHVAELATRHATFERFNSHNHAWVPASFPRELAEKYVARGQSDLRSLAGIVHAPLLRHDGTILERPGYDDQTGLYFEPGETVFPAMLQHPTRDDAMAALGRLLALVRDFPFVEPVHRTVFLSGLLTAVARRSLRSAPLTAFTSPVAGSGKSMLVDIIAIVATGQCAPVIAQASGEEMEKRLVASFMAGDAVIAIDNCIMPIGGIFLCAALTQETVRMRVLGLSRNVEAPSNAAVFANGNNLAVLSDMTRRTLMSRLDPGVERPELRPFDVDPIAEARNNRPQLVADVVTILRAGWLAPIDPRPPLGSFPDWSRMVRDILIWLGQDDVATTIEANRLGDPDLTSHVAVLAAVHAVFPPPRQFTAKDLIEFSARKPMAGEQRDPRAETLYDALAAVALSKSGASIDPRRLGNWLASKKDRLVTLPDEENGGSMNLAGPLAFRMCGSRQGVALWTIQGPKP